MDFQEVTVCSFDREADRGVLGLCIEMNKIKNQREESCLIVRQNALASVQ